MNLIKLLALFGIGYYVGKNGLQLPAPTGGVRPAPTAGQNIELRDQFGNIIR